MRKYQNNKEVKVLYLGTPEIAVKPLLGLIQSGFNVVGVVTQEDKIAGRGKGELEMSPVKKLALKAGLPVFQPHRIKQDFSFAKSLDFDVIVCMAYGQIVPDDFINLAPKKAINLHGSLLPKLRGAAPIQRSIIEGFEETGISLMAMVNKMDAGDVFDKRSIKIEENDTYSSLNAKLGDLAKEMIMDDLLAYVNDELQGIQQNENEVTYAKKILAEDEHLSLNLTSLEMNRYIRGLADEPGAYIFLRGKKLKIYSTCISDRKVDEGILLAVKNTVYLGTKDGSLILNDVKYEGKKRMPASSFANGIHLPKEGEKVE